MPTDRAPATHPTQPAAGPLAGLRIADLSTVLAGPYCTMVLADLGADVIKLEPPEGDATRGWGPPWVGAGSEGESAGERVAAYYLSVNRNKRSLRLDLRAEGGRAVLRRLLADSDALVENFRPGSLARLGLDDEELSQLNPGLIHLAISGYGPDGPDAAKPGYDFVAQAVGGLMSITGFPDEEGGRPTKVGVAISDVVTGLLGAIALLAALRARDAGAGGQRIDASLLGSTLAVLVNQAQNAFVSGVAPGRLGNVHPNIAPYETFATQDGEIVLAVGSERQWPRLCQALGLEPFASDERFASNAARVEHRAELRALLEERFHGGTSAEWLARLEAGEVPCGPVNDVLAAFNQPQAQHLGMNASVEHALLGRLRLAGIPFQLSATPATIRTAPPLLGEHTDEVLAELGYGGDEIERLRREGVV